MRPPPHGMRSTRGQDAPERKCIVAALRVIWVAASVEEFSELKLLYRPMAVSREPDCVPGARALGQG